MFKTPYTDRRHRAIDYLRRYGRVRYDLAYRGNRIPLNAPRINNQVVYIQYFG